MRTEQWGWGEPTDVDPAAVDEPLQPAPTTTTTAPAPVEVVEVPPSSPSGPDGLEDTVQPEPSAVVAVPVPSTTLDVLPVTGVEHVAVLLVVGLGLVSLGSWLQRLARRISAG